ncbi:GNAT family N-acetyltransferase [Wenxinia saemankumensis]|uniref:Predicted N-acetyltransferase YhbS n=1 Tax=Wenxinia saemankumensis TaxID=1447782 RepID=A0A1M6G4K9_9RHOB|nr:GNAT family N-acetyltransferase [Wenxinia saemankumensis]SHJ04916.1 Predicted N-acetyltransferase YhbS [Wenxinia saemankumensis]
MQFERIPEWALTRPDEAAIAALLAASFDSDFGGRSFFKTRHHLRVVARDADGRVAGHVGLTYRAIRLGAPLVDILGLADVAVDPAHRGQGIASRLMEEVVAIGRDSPAEFLVLFGDRPLYAGSGFVPKTNALRFPSHDDARSGDLVERRVGELMVLPLGGTAWDEDATVDLAGSLF